MKYLLHKKLKASSLLYAIFVCLVVALLCGSLVLIFNYQYRLKQQYFLEEEFVLAHNNQRIALLEQLNGEQIELTNELFKSSYKLQKWGFYNLLVHKTYFKTDTLTTASLLGKRPNRQEQLALYLTDLDKPLHIGGKTKIKGNVKISKYGVKPAYINNMSYIGSKLIYGNITHSNKRLPQLDSNIINPSKEEASFNEFFIEDLETLVMHRSFTKSTTILHTSGLVNIEGLELSGNIILKSNDSIHIKANTRLENILIEARSVSFEKGFKGTVQVFAKDWVTLQEGAELYYPSSVCINNDDNEKELEIVLEKDSKVAGGIVFTGDSYQSSLNRMVTIEENAELIGDLYCYGKTQLKGKVVGTVYTDRFYLKTPSSVYENYIINGEINVEELPNEFINLPLFNTSTSKYEVIKEL